MYVLIFFFFFNLSHIPFPCVRLIYTCKNNDFYIKCDKTNILNAQTEINRLQNSEM
jgi:hypothetical protein